MISSRLKAYFLLTIAAIIWAISTPVIKLTLSGISPLPFLTYRFFISSLVSLLFFILSKNHFQKIKRHFFEIFIYGFVTTTLTLGILFIGIDKTTVVNTALLAAIGPLITILAGSIFLKEIITRQEKIGITIALIGTIFTILEPLVNGKLDNIQAEGNSLIVIHLIIAAYSSVLAKRLLRKDVSPLTLVNSSFIVGFFTILPLTVFQTGFAPLIKNVVALNTNYHLGVLYMALFSGTLAYSFWVKAQKTIEISEASVFSYLIPIFAAPLGIILLKETVMPLFWVGALIIAIGVIIAEYKKKRKQI